MGAAGRTVAAKTLVDAVFVGRDRLIPPFYRTRRGAATPPYNCNSM
jgi:hypothetical protein